MSGRKVPACPACRWKPAARARRKGNQEPVPDWRDVPGVMSVLFSRRPDLAASATAGARLYAAIVENA